MTPFRFDKRQRSSALRFVLLWAALLLWGCGAAPATSSAPQPTPTLPAFMQPEATAAAPTATPAPAGVTITVDSAQNVHPISPYIYGLSGAEANTRAALRPTVNSWGGNTSTRYNWQLGNAWSAARDWGYRNGNYNYHGSAALQEFVEEAQADGADVRVAVPTLGWVAKNDDINTCSFPLADGSCGDADKATCEKPGLTADPTTTSVQSDVASVEALVRDLQRRNLNVRFFAMDNEPELWGITHYDVHPECTTYQEIRDRYLQYAGAIRALAPEAELLGPVTCCWYFYWNSAAGSADKIKNGNTDFLPWFLQQVRAHDERRGVRTLDVLDIHYYPADLYNDKADPQTAAHRLRSTRALWDATYTDESWINTPIQLIPRMKQLIDANYPGLKLGITEWNFGADGTTNGALAIADVLGIYGREDLYLANYWRAPEFGSPGFFAFKLYRNYDDNGGSFGDTSIHAESSAPEKVTAYAATDSATKRTTIMLINKDPENSTTAALRLGGIPAGNATLYRYSEAAPTAITKAQVSLAENTLDLPPYSISLLVLEAN